MNRAQHRLLNSRGANLKNLMHSVITDADHMPGRAELRTQIRKVLDELGVDETADAKLLGELTRIAEKAQDRKQRFQLRGEADRLALAMIEKLDAADRLVPLPEQDDEIDYAQLAADTIDTRDHGSTDNAARNRDADAGGELFR